MFTARLDGRLVSTYSAHEFDRAECPECNWPVMAKRGPGVTHHWAHMPSGPNCQNQNGETEWHLNWKRQFDQTRAAIECVKVDAKGETHRADVWMPIRGISNPGRALEFQSRPIDLDELAERQRAWVNVVWVLNCAGESIQRVYGATRGALEGYDWPKIPPMVWRGVNPWQYGAQIYLDLGDGRMLDVASVDFRDPVAKMWARPVLQSEFIAEMLRDAAAPEISLTGHGQNGS